MTPALDQDLAVLALLLLALGQLALGVWLWWTSCRRRGHDDLELTALHNDGRVAWRARRCQRCGSLRFDELA
ncbi:hypothetical protein QEX66_gp26 [Arthrobacter phage Corgi]|uniref:Uncharacterized protein n=1 Tax=Arthrobacter phage Corgi TaxID=2419952 RepID=A0A3G2KF05_9CAUD|nr:hypothetical protein QEX66_gp26 [Arthrobacter phage Corgi]AYN57574.1 hypothetical protein PBI_CORGI_26 [Arthrobacter phage Corgi]